MNIQQLFITAGLLTSLSVQAQQERALPILTQGKDARSVAMGGNTYGSSANAALYTNPSAALNTAQPTNITAYYHSQTLKGDTPFTLTGTGLSASYRFGQHALLVGTRYYGGLKYTEIGQNEKTAATRTLYDQTFDLGYAIAWGKWNTFVSASYVLTRQMRTASTFAATLGASYHDAISSQLHYNATAKVGNLGNSFSYIKKGKSVYPPTFVGLGGELNYAKGTHATTLALGLEQYFLPSEAASTAWNIGAEYAYRQTGMLRLGYTHDTNGFSAFTMGLGIKFKKYHFDVALQNPNNSNVSSQYLLSAGITF